MLAVAADSYLGEVTRRAAPRRSCAGPAPWPRARRWSIQSAPPAWRSAAWPVPAPGWL